MHSALLENVVVNLCVPVFARYDLLQELLCSLDASTIPVHVYIIDNGRNEHGLANAIIHHYGAYSVFTPIVPMTSAAVWNWFIEIVPEERVLVDNDVLFSPDSLAQLSAGPGDLVMAAGIHGLSCFVIRDTCVQKAGLFDEVSLDRVQDHLDVSGVIQSVVTCGISRTAL